MLFSSFSFLTFMFVKKKYVNLRFYIRQRLQTETVKMSVSVMSV